MPAAFTTYLGLALPIIQGPMTGSATPALSAAVSEAGGLGMLGCGMRSPAAMAEAAAEVRRRGYQSPALDALHAALRASTPSSLPEPLSR